MTNSEHEFDWGAFGLMAALVLFAAWGVSSAGWTSGLWVLQFAAIGAALAGGALAYSQFDGMTSAVIAWSYGVGWVGFLLAAAIPGDLTWHQRSFLLIYRLLQFIKQLLIGGKSGDTLMFVLIHGALFWIMGVACAWYVLRRGNVWAGCLPGGVVLVINLVYYNGPAPVLRFLGYYLALALLLLARTHVWAQQSRWREARVGFSSEVRFQSWRSALMASIVILGLSWFAPGFAANPRVVTVWRNVTSPYETVRTTWQRMFATIYGAPVATGDYYSASLALTGGPKLTNRQIMEVRAPPQYRYYWRARTYDLYEGGRWTPGEISRLELPAFEPGALRPNEPDRPLLPGAPPPGMLRPAYAARQPVVATFYMDTPATSLLYSVPQPLSFSRDVTLDAVVDRVNEYDVQAARVSSLLQKGSSYSVLSSLSVASDDELRLASDVYPPDIRERYLQLPDTITERTLALGRQLTEGQPTAYDAALAVQTYLRNSITYSLDIPDPPENQDPVDWVLFDERQGYCNYYASAMVILLRSAGIPARLSVGFIQGTFDPEGDVYRVIESDAHAWPEVYIPLYGWVEFEPTASQPVIDRTAQAIENTLGPTPPPSLSEALEATREASSTAVPAAQNNAANGAGMSGWLWLAGVTATAGAGWWLWRRRQAQAPSSLAATAYTRLERAARWVGVRPGPAWTARERAEALARLLPGRRVEIEQITREYESEVYARRASAAVPSADFVDVQAAWRKLAPDIWRGALRWGLRQLVRGGREA